MAEIDLPLLQAQVLAQGLLLRALAKSIDDPTRVREIFAADLAKLLPTLSGDTMGFVSVHAELLMRQFSRPVEAKPAVARSA